MPENWPEPVVVEREPVRATSSTAPVTNCRGQSNSPPQKSKKSPGSASKKQASKVDSSKQVSKADGGASKTATGSKPNGGQVNAKVTAVSTASLDVNAKEFTPKTSMVQHKVHPHPRFEPYPSGFNPHPVSYPYVTNGVPMPYMYYVPVGTMPVGPGPEVRDRGRPTQLGPRPLGDSATSTSSGYVSDMYMYMYLYINVHVIRTCMYVYISLQSMGIEANL